MKSLLDVLLDSVNSIEESKKTPTPDSYWEEEDKLVAEIKSSNEK